MNLQRYYDEFYKDGVITNKSLNLNRWPRNRFEASLKFVNIRKGFKVLDVGCRQGIMLPYLLEKTDCVFGTDISEKQICALKKHYKNEVLFEHADMENKSSFKDNFFDVIICLDVIEHINDRYSIMNEFSRILKNGGVLVIVTPNVVKIRNRLKFLFGKYPATSYDKNEGYGIRVGAKNDLYDGGHLQYFTYKTLEILLKKYNFKVIKKAGVGRFGKLHDFFPEFMSGEIVMVTRKY